MTLAASIKRLVHIDDHSDPPKDTLPDPRMASIKVSSRGPPRRTKSQADIFERDILKDDQQELDVETPSNSVSLSQSPTPRDIPIDLPRHLVSEDYTSPVLDSTVELIANGDYDGIDVVQVPHRRASLGLLKTCSRSSINSLPSSPRLSVSRKYSNSSSLTKLNTRQNYQSESSDCLIPQCTCTSSSIDQSHSLQRKSIPFYSYSDLVNFERMSHMSPTSNNNNNNNNNTSTFGSPTSADLDSQQQLPFDFSDPCPEDSVNPSCPRHRIHRRPTIQQGGNNETEFTIEEQMEAPAINIPIPTARSLASSNRGSASPLSVGVSHRGEPDSAVIDDDEDDNESILVWLPQDSNNNEDDGSNTTLHRRKSVVEDLASLKSTVTSNSYFEDELESEIGEPLINVCSAKDFLKTKSRELRKSFVDNDGNTRRLPISQ